MSVSGYAAARDGAARPPRRAKHRHTHAVFLSFSRMVSSNGPVQPRCGPLSIRHILWAATKISRGRSQIIPEHALVINLSRKTMGCLVLHSPLRKSPAYLAGVCRASYLRRSILANGALFFRLCRRPLARKRDDHAGNFRQIHLILHPADIMATLGIP